MRDNLAEMLVVVLVIATSIVFFIISLGFPHMRADPAGGALWPQLMSLGAGGGACVLLAKRLLAMRPDRESTSAPGFSRRTAVIILASIFYPFLILLIGFAAGTVAFTALLMVVLDAKSWEVILFSPLFTAAIYFFFVYLLGAVVPQGALMPMLTG